MFSLTYVSSACIQFDTVRLEELLVQCRRKNDAVGLTGMLLFKGGNFMQVLEGPESVVRATQRKIEGDPRHTGFLVLLQETLPARRFSEWSMGFRHLDPLNRESMPPGYDDFLNTPLTDARFRDHPEASQKLLQMFKKHM